MKTAAVFCRDDIEKDSALQFAYNQNLNITEIYQDKRDILFKSILGNIKKFDIIIIMEAVKAAETIPHFVNHLKELINNNANLIFVNTDLTYSDNSTFMITMLTDIENMKHKAKSDAIKKGKRQNAEKGKVPNLIFGYDKANDDPYSLSINPSEAQIVKRVFHLYVHNELGTNRIAQLLNKEGITTKRNCNWSQIAISRMLSNKIYTGKLVNGKQTVSNTQTKKRMTTDKEQWIIINRPELQIIDEDLFKKANQILKSRSNTFNMDKRVEEKHIFSTLIKCKCCGSSFRRQVRKYKNEYIRWVCTGRNANGADTCPNKTAINEDELVSAIRGYFHSLLSAKQNVMKIIKRSYEAKYNSLGNESILKELKTKEERLQTRKQKQLQLYEEDIISIQELKISFHEIADELSVIDKQIQTIEKHILTSQNLDTLLENTFDSINQIFHSDIVTNSMLGKLIDKIVVDENQNVDIYLKIFADLGLDETLLT